MSSFNKKIFCGVTIGHVLLIALIFCIPFLKGLSTNTDNLIEVVDLGDFGDGGEALTGETKGDGSTPQEIPPAPQPLAPQKVEPPKPEPKAEPVEEESEEVSDPEPTPEPEPVKIPDPTPIEAPKPKPIPPKPKPAPKKPEVSKPTSTKKTTKDIKVNTKIVKGTSSSSSPSSATKPSTGAGVSSSEVKSRLSGVMKSSVGVIGAGGPGKGGYGGSGVSGSAMANYHGLIKNEIERQWTKPNLDSDKLETSVAISISQDGTVRFISIDKSSGNSDMDQSVKQAVQSVGKLSRSLPPGVEAPYEIVISFKLS
jgi:TonB family protein